MSFDWGSLTHVYPIKYKTENKSIVTKHFFSKSQFFCARSYPYGAPIS